MDSSSVKTPTPVCTLKWRNTSTPRITVDTSHVYLQQQQQQQPSQVFYHFVHRRRTSTASYACLPACLPATQPACRPCALASWPASPHDVEVVAVADQHRHHVILRDTGSTAVEVQPQQQQPWNQ